MSSPDLFRKALEAAASARDNLDEHRPDSAVNRAYYAMFNAARSFLQSRGVDIADSSHGAIVQLFGLHAIKPGLVPGHFGRLFHQAQEARSTADYEYMSVEEVQAEVFVVAAEEMVDRISAFLPDLPADAVRRPSAKARASSTLKQRLVEAFRALAIKRGHVLPDDWIEKIADRATEDEIERLIADIDEMRDVLPYVFERAPDLKP